MRLRELREERGLSQIAFSKQIGFAQNTVSQWENGNRTLDVNTAILIANHFDVSVDYLIGNSHIRNIKALLEEKIKDGTIQIVGRDGSFFECELTDDQIDIIRRMIEQMQQAEPKVDTLLGVTPKQEKAPSEGDTVIPLAAYDGSDDEPAITSQEELDAAPDLKL